MKIRNLLKRKSGNVILPTIGTIIALTLLAGSTVAYAVNSSKIIYREKTLAQSNDGKQIVYIASRYLSESLNDTSSNLSDMAKSTLIKEELKETFSYLEITRTVVGNVITFYVYYPQDVEARAAVDDYADYDGLWYKATVEKVDNGMSSITDYGDNGINNIAFSDTAKLEEKYNIQNLSTTLLADISFLPQRYWASNEISLVESDIDTYDEAFSYMNKMGVLEVDSVGVALYAYKGLNTSGNTAYTYDKDGNIVSDYTMIYKTGNVGGNFTWQFTNGADVSTNQTNVYREEYDIAKLQGMISYLTGYFQIFADGANGQSFTYNYDEFTDTHEINYAYRKNGTGDTIQTAVYSETSEQFAKDLSDYIFYTNMARLLLVLDSEKDQQILKNIRDAAYKKYKDNSGSGTLDSSYDDKLSESFNIVWNTEGFKFQLYVNEKETKRAFEEPFTLAELTEMVTNSSKTVLQDDTGVKYTKSLTSTYQGNQRIVDALLVAAAENNELEEKVATLKANGYNLDNSLFLALMNQARYKLDPYKDIDESKTLNAYIKTWIESNLIDSYCIFDNNGRATESYSMDEYLNGNHREDPFLSMGQKISATANSQPYNNILIHDVAYVDSSTVVANPSGNDTMRLDNWKVYINSFYDLEHPIKKTDYRPAETNDEIKDVFEKYLKEEQGINVTKIDQIVIDVERQTTETTFDYAETVDITYKRSARTNNYSLNGVKIADLKSYIDDPKNDTIEKALLAYCKKKGSSNANAIVNYTCYCNTYFTVKYSYNEETPVAKPVTITKTTANANSIAGTTSSYYNAAKNYIKSNVDSNVANVTKITSTTQYTFSYTYYSANTSNDNVVSASVLGLGANPTDKQIKDALKKYVSDNNLHGNGFGVSNITGYTKTDAYDINYTKMESKSGQEDFGRTEYEDILNTQKYMIAFQYNEYKLVTASEPCEARNGYLNNATIPKTAYQEIVKNEALIAARDADTRINDEEMRYDNDVNCLEYLRQLMSKNIAYQYRPVTTLAEIIGGEAFSLTNASANDTIDGLKEQTILNDLVTYYLSNVKNETISAYLKQGYSYILKYKNVSYEDGSNGCINLKVGFALCFDQNKNYTYSLEVADEVTFTIKLVTWNLYNSDGNQNMKVTTHEGATATNGNAYKGVDVTDGKAKVLFDYVPITGNDGKSLTADALNGVSDLYIETDSNTVGNFDIYNQMVKTMDRVVALKSVTPLDTTRENDNYGTDYVRTGLANNGYVQIQAFKPGDKVTISQNSFIDGTVNLNSKGDTTITIEKGKSLYINGDLYLNAGNSRGSVEFDPCQIKLTIKEGGMLFVNGTVYVKYVYNSNKGIDGTMKGSKTMKNSGVDIDADNAYFIVNGDFIYQACKATIDTNEPKYGPGAKDQSSNYSRFNQQNLLPASYQDPNTKSNCSIDDRNTDYTNAHVHETDYRCLLSGIFIINGDVVFKTSYATDFYDDFVRTGRPLPEYGGDNSYRGQLRINSVSNPHMNATWYVDGVFNAEFLHTTSLYDRCRPNFIFASSLVEPVLKLQEAYYPYWTNDYSTKTIDKANFNENNGFVFVITEEAIVGEFNFPCTTLFTPYDTLKASIESGTMKDDMSKVLEAAFKDKYKDEIINTWGLPSILKQGEEDDKSWDNASKDMFIDLVPTIDGDDWTD